MHAPLIGWPVKTGHAGTGGMHVRWRNRRYSQSLGNRCGQVCAGLLHTDDMIVRGAASPFPQRTVSSVQQHAICFGRAAIDSEKVGHTEECSPNPTNVKRRKQNRQDKKVTRLQYSGGMESPSN